LVCVRESGAQPVIVLNKADLCPGANEAARLLRDADPGQPVVTASAVTGAGLKGLEGHLPSGGTTALAGPSGAGKSSLVNALLQREHLRVGAVRERDRRGKHTTTRRELVVHPQGWLLMDLPGIRELCPWSRPETVDEVFPEIATLGLDCYYRDCRHASEPGCSVRTAAREGRIDRGRLNSYLELRREQETLLRSMEESRS
jgi:ribosome biogenesis GTPase